MNNPVVLAILVQTGVFFIMFLKMHNSNVRRLQDIETKVNVIFKWFERNVVKSNGS